MIILYFTDPLLSIHVPDPDSYEIKTSSTGFDIYNTARVGA